MGQDQARQIDQTEKEPTYPIPLYVSSTNPENRLRMIVGFPHDLDPAATRKTGIVHQAVDTFTETLSMKGSLFQIQSAPIGEFPIPNDLPQPSNPDIPAILLSIDHHAFIPSLIPGVDLLKRATQYAHRFEMDPSEVITCTILERLTEMLNNTLITDFFNIEIDSSAQGKLSIRYITRITGLYGRFLGTILENPFFHKIAPPPAVFKDQLQLSVQRLSKYRKALGKGLFISPRDGLPPSDFQRLLPHFLSYLMAQFDIACSERSPFASWYLNTLFPYGLRKALLALDGTLPETPGVTHITEGDPEETQPPEISDPAD